MASDILIRLRMAGQQRFNQDSKGIARDIGQIGARVAVVSTTLVQAGQAFAAFGLAGVGLTASLAPLVGLVGALPAAGALGAQGLGVVKLSLVGVTDAVGGLNEALDPEKFAALSDEGRAFALELDSLKGPVRELQAAVQKGALPGFTEGLEAARPALDALRGPLAGTGSVIGGLAAQLGKLVGSKGFLADLRGQAAFNNVQLGRLGGAGLHLVNVFRHLMVEGRPLVDWLVKLVSGWASTADAMTTAGRKSGGLAAGFREVQVTTSRVFRILGDVGAALWNIGRIGKREIGDGILLHLVAAADALHDWTSSEAGIDKITAAFQWSRDTIRDIGDFLERANTSAGPGLADLLGNLVDAINPILASGGSVGVLSLYAGGLNLIAQACELLVNNVPGSADALSALVAIMLVNKLAGVNVIAVAIRAIAVAAAFALAPMAGLYTAFWALNAAIAANPIGAAVIAILAIGAALIYAYKHSETFRDIVNAVGGALKTGLLWGLEAVIDALDFLIGGFSSMLSALGHVPGMGWARDAARDIDKAREAMRKFGDELDDESSKSRSFSMTTKKRSTKAIHAAERAGAFTRGPAARLPGMASGGTVTRGGLFRVGEDGEEVLELPGASVVHPGGAGADQGLVVAAINRLAAAVLARPVNVQIGREPVARATVDQLAEDAAFA